MAAGESGLGIYRPLLAFSISALLFVFVDLVSRKNLSHFNMSAQVDQTLFRFARPIFSANGVSGGDLKYWKERPEGRLRSRGRAQNAAEIVRTKPGALRSPQPRCRAWR